MATVNGGIVCAIAHRLSPGRDIYQAIKVNSLFSKDYLSLIGDNEHAGCRLATTADVEAQKTKNPAEAGFKIGRRERIRTSDPLVPNQLRYQAALLADVLLFEFLVQFIKSWCEGGDLNPHVRKDTNT